MTKYLVLGSHGFIGSHLVDRLIAEDKDNVVICVDDLSGGSLQNGNGKAISYFFDLRDVKETAQFVDLIKPEVIYFLAANAAENKAQFSPIDITTRNLNTFLNVIVPAINNGVKRVIVTSSIAVYGAGQVPFKETDVPMPEDIYGVGKLAMEQTLKILADVHGFEYVIVRPFNVYGPRQNMRDPYRNVVTIWMNSILKGEPYYIYGDGEQQRAFTYIDDVVDALVKCSLLPIANITFNIGSDKVYSLNELSKLLLEVTGSNLAPIYLPKREREVNKAIADTSLARQYLYYSDTFDLKAGLEKTWKWCKDVGYQEPIYKGIEIGSDKIPKNWIK